MKEHSIQKLYLITSFIDEGEKIEVMMVGRGDDRLSVDYTSDEADEFVERFIEEDGIIGKNGAVDFDCFIRALSTELGRPVSLLDCMPGSRTSVSPGTKEVS